MFSKNTLLNSFLISFIISILVNNYLQDFLLTLIISLLIFIIFIILHLYKNNILKHFVLLIFIIIWNILWVFTSKSFLDTIKSNENYLEKHYLRKEIYEFKVENLYKKYDFYNTYIVQIYKINWTIVDKNLWWLVYIPSNLTLEKGQLIYTNSQILIVDNVDNFRWYKNFLLSKNIYFKSYLYNFDIISKDNNIITKLDKFRSKIINIINKIYPKDSSILISWMLLWARENIPKSLNTNLNNSWTTHIIAVSWFNITILIVFLWFVFKYFPVYIRTLLIISSLIIFCIFVWLEASVVRAWIMWIIWYLITLSWRKNKSLTLLLLTAFLMILYNPYYINYDISFQLSFLAVLWIVYTKDFFEKTFKFLPNTLAIRESFSLTLSAMTFTLPIMIFNFWQVSLLSPISNLLIVWNIPLIMFIWFLSIIWFYMFPIIWTIIWFFAFVLISWDLSVIKYFWSLDLFIIKTNFWEYSFYFKIMYFIIIIFLILINKKEIR